MGGQLRGPMQAASALVTFSLHCGRMFQLIPREVKFFDLFDQQAQNIIKASQLLRELVNNFADAPGQGPRHQGSRARTGDLITHEIVRKLNTTVHHTDRPGGHPRPGHPAWTTSSTSSRPSPSGSWSIASKETTSGVSGPWPT